MPTNETTSEGMVLGLDPGLGITGYGILSTRTGRPTLVEAGIIRIARGRPLADRLKELFEGVVEILGSFTIRAVAIEQL